MKKNSHVSLLLEFDFSELFSVCHHVLVLNTHNTTTPGSSELFVVVELSLEVLGEEFQILVVFLSNVSQSNASSGLLVNKFTESCLSLNEGEGDTLLSAESWEECHQFNWVNIVSHNNDLGFSFFNKSGNVVKTELKNEWLGGFLGVSTAGFSLSLLLKSSLLFFFRLWFVFCK